MGVYLKEFENHTQYEFFTTDTENFIKPNISLCVQENEVHFNPLVETKLVIKVNITDTSSPIRIGNYGYMDNFSSVEIDDVELPSVVTNYTFNTIGEHTIKYTLVDPTFIKGNVFNGCDKFTSIFIPNSVTNIGNFTFADCNSLTSINIPDGVTSIGNHTFNNCSGLTSINIPDGVTSIGEHTFWSCSGLTSINIPDGVTSIGEQAFYFCLGLTSVTVNATTPPTLGSSAFNYTNDCLIYVPSASVETYKTADNWNNYANRIQAIS